MARPTAKAPFFCPPKPPVVPPASRLDIHIHFPEGFMEVISGIRTLIAGQEQIMATMNQYQEALTRIDTATTRIGADITTLLGRITGGGLTDAEEAEVLTQIGQRAAALEAIADSVENPVPPLPPPVTP